MNVSLKLLACKMLILEMFFAFFIKQKNAAIGGALTGALLSFSDGTFTRDKIIQHSITGGAIATASEFIRNIT